MGYRKEYGMSKFETCPFCDRQAITKNNQGMLVCSKHINEEFNNLKCICGLFVDMKKSKHGVYFSCPQCGNMNVRKILEANVVKPKTNQ